MEYGEIFNEAFDLYKRNFPLLIGIGAVVYVPYALVAALANQLPLLAGLMMLCLFIPMIAASGATVKAIADRYLGREATIGGSWGYVLQRLWPYLWTSLLAVLMVMAGFLLLCVPGIIIAFWIFFVWYVMIVEDRYYGDAIRRSRELAAGQWGRIFAISLLTGVLTFGVSMITGVIAAVLQLSFASPTGPQGGPAEVPMTISLFQGLLNAGLQTVIAPLTTLLSVLLYFDVRVRKEGFDIELLAREMREPPIGGGQWSDP
jgi:hypothetical protein